LSIGRLRLASGDRVLVVGAGTGLDFDFLPSNVHVTAIDVTPAML
jgi:phosphatidylethanolamine/phosphatidyl-N-methylethanolamine N-methyltransferase